MIVGNFMSKNVVKIDKDQNLKDALDLMEKKKVSRLIVVEDEKLVGVITFRDVMEILGSKKYANVPPTSLHVSMAMTKNPITVSENTSLKDARDLMLKNNISTLPVVDDDGYPIGIITKTDLLKPLKDLDKNISEVYNSNVITIEPKARLIHARRLMLENNIGRLIVTERDKIVGIITDKDIARAFYKVKRILPEKHYEENIKRLLVEDFMTQNVISIRHDAKISECIRIMFEKRISGLPVLKGDSLHAIITKTDIIKLI